MARAARLNDPGFELMRFYSCGRPGKQVKMRGEITQIEALENNARTHRRYGYAGLLPDGKTLGGQGGPPAAGVPSSNQQ